MKGRSLGERPAFLRSPPGCGVVEALGCVGRGFDEAAWGPLGGLGGTLMGAGALGWGTLPNWDEIPFGYELRRRTMISNERNLTNRPRPRHLQNCISASGDFHRIPMFRAYCEHQIVKKGDSDLVPRPYFLDNYHLKSTVY